MYLQQPKQLIYQDPVLSMRIHSNYCSQNDSSEDETIQQTNDLKRYCQSRDLFIRRPSIALILQQKKMQQQDNPCTSFEPKYYQPDYCKECSKHQCVHYNSKDQILTEKESILKTNKDTRKDQISTAVRTSNGVNQANQQKNRSFTVSSVNDLTNSTAHQESCKQQLGLSKIFESYSDSDLTKVAGSTAVRVESASSQILSTTQSINSHNNDNVIKDKIRTLFYHVDVNHDGYVDEDEFVNLIQKLGLSKQSQRFKFDKIIKKDEKRLTFDELYHFLLSRITHKSKLDSNLDNKPKDARRMEKFKQKLERQISDKLENNEEFSTRMQSLLENIDCNEITEYLAQRWINFNNFQRL
ncbi:unnamed protein product, partial [Didymodactylos carnosus]